MVSDKEAADIERLRREGVVGPVRPEMDRPIA